MGLFGSDDAEVENAVLDCEPQNEYVSEETVAEIDDLLRPGERVRYLAKGTGGGLELADGGRNWRGNEKNAEIATKGRVRTAATDQRLVIEVPQLTGSNEYSVPYENVTSIDVNTSLMSVRLTIQTPGQTYRPDVDGLTEETAREMAEFVREQMSADGGDADVDADPLDQLERLRDLHEDGVVSDEEFEEKKRESLDKV